MAIARGTGFVRGNKTKARERLRAHLAYLVFRKMGEHESLADRTIFTKKVSWVSKDEALRDIMDHTSPSVNFHKIVLSPSLEEPVRNWQEWTRRVMHDLEEHLGKELHWYAVHHQNTDNPHVHIVLAGVGESLETGIRGVVRLTVTEYQRLRASGTAHSEFEWHQQLIAIADDLDRQDTLGSAYIKVDKRSHIDFVSLLPGEAKVGTYKELNRQGKRGDRLTPHHIPAASYMAQYGVDRANGISLTMEQPKIAGRHRLTRTYGTGSMDGESPRQALARDIANVRAIYQSQGLLTVEVVTALREIIRQNRERFPQLFEKR